ncbi:MAG: Uncharacterized protein G01um10145_176 [Microgenomates group bacterium Gr01-1014_5]|nr:MAG: Uncharacterized protein G01um10145_176 [Microgenomates group bacterium Gr01-1014_5]
MSCDSLYIVRILNILIFAVFSFVLLFAPVAFATDASPSAMEVPLEKINPDDGFAYLTKRLEEKVKLFLFSLSANSKENFYKELANRRLAELKYVIENDKKGNFEVATIRYSSTVGEWTEFILDEKLDESKGPAVEVLTKHLPVVEKLMTKYDGTTAEWRFVKQDFDYLNIYISKLQN